MRRRSRSTIGRLRSIRARTGSSSSVRARGSRWASSSSSTARARLRSSPSGSRAASSTCGRAGSVARRSRRRSTRRCAAPAPTALPVFVPSLHVMPSTQREGDTGDRPTTWPVWLADRTIAHEMGHYFGFADGYLVEVRAGCYYLVYDRPDDVMSSPYGAVLPEQLAALVRAYGPRT